MLYTLYPDHLTSVVAIWHWDVIGIGHLFPLLGSMMAIRSQLFPVFETRQGAKSYATAFRWDVFIDVGHGIEVPIGLFHLIGIVCFFNVTNLQKSVLPMTILCMPVRFVALGLGNFHLRPVHSIMLSYVAILHCTPFRERKDRIEIMFNKEMSRGAHTDKDNASVAIREEIGDGVEYAPSWYHIFLIGIVLDVADAVWRRFSRIVGMSDSRVAEMGGRGAESIDFLMAPDVVST